MPFVLRVENGYPLILQNVTSVEYEETEFREGTLLTLLNKLNLKTIVTTWNEQLEPYCVGNESCVTTNNDDNSNIPVLMTLPSTEEELRSILGLPEKEGDDEDAQNEEGDDNNNKQLGDEDANAGPPSSSSASPPDEENRIQLLKTLHTILLDLHVMEGELKCPSTGRIFPIKGGIPNMILHADEI